MALERYGNSLPQDLDKDPLEVPNDDKLVDISQGIGAGLTLTGEQYQTPIEELFLSVRAYNCLKRTYGQLVEERRVTFYGEERTIILYKGPVVGEVLSKSEEELLGIRNLGRGSLAEIKNALGEFIGRRLEELRQST